MKKLLVILIVAVAGCKPVETTVYVRDSVYIPVHDTTVYIAHDTAYVSVIQTVPVVDLRLVDSLKTALFIEKYRLERIRYYIGIVDRNTSQEKYLKGWIKRALR